MVRMMMRVDHKLDGLVGYRMYFFHHPRVIVILRWRRVLRVHNNETLIRDPDQSVSASTGDLVKIRLQHLDLLNGLACCSATSTALGERRDGKRTGGRRNSHYKQCLA